MNGHPWVQPCPTCGREECGWHAKGGRCDAVVRFPHTTEVQADIVWHKDPAELIDGPEPWWPWPIWLLVIACLTAAAALTFGG